MADWSKPTITSNYVTFVDEVKNRDIDAITLQVYAVTNPPVASVKMLRLTHPQIKFQEFDGTSYQDKILSVAGGGTGAANLSGLGTAMGLGTMAYQNSNTVSITGGTATAVALYSCTHQGGLYVTNFSSALALNIAGGPNMWSMQIVPNSTGGAGLLLYGTAAGQLVLYVLRNSDGLVGMTISTEMRVTCPTALVIPVGTDKY